MALVPSPQLNSPPISIYKTSKVTVTLNKSNIPDQKSDNIRLLRVENGEIDSQELFQSQREVLIRHGENVYRLRLTSLNKLILTK